MSFQFVLKEIKVKRKKIYSILHNVLSSFIQISYIFIYIIFNNNHLSRKLSSAFWFSTLLTCAFKLLNTLIIFWFLVNRNNFEWYFSELSVGTDSFILFQIVYKAIFTLQNNKKPNKIWKT